MKAEKLREIEALLAKAGMEAPPSDNGHGEVETLALSKPQRVKPRRLTEKEVVVGLQRRWRLTYPEREVPEDIGVLRRLVPSGLIKREEKTFLLGAVEDAKATFLRLFNTSYTKADFQRKIAEAGLHNGLRAFDKGTQEDLLGAIQFLPPE